MEVSGSSVNKVIWEVVDDNFVEKGKDHDEIGLRGFGFNFFDEKGVIIEVLSEYHYLLMLMKL